MLELLIDLFWLDVVFIVAGITAVFVSMKKHRVPAMTPLDDRSVDGGPPVPLNRFEAELQELGFEYCGDYDFGVMSSIKLILQGYLSQDRRHAVVIAHLETEYESFAMIEFSTDLTPFGSISTNNYRMWETFRYPMHKVLANVPWNRSAREVYDLHVSLCEIAGANGYAAKPIEPARFAEEIRSDTRRDLEWQVRKGIMVKVATDVYRLSLVGTTLGVPKIWIQMTYGLLFRWYRRDDESFRRALQRRFDKIRAVGYTPG